MNDRITAEQVGEYFGRKWKRKECPFCEGQKWDVAANSGGVLVFGMAEFDQSKNATVFRLGPDDGETSDRSIAPCEAVISIRCAECGFVANFDLNTVKTKD